MTLSKEREQEIREQWKDSTSEELLTEIDRLRECLAGSNADLIGQEHRLGSRIEVLEKREKNLKNSLARNCGYSENFIEAIAKGIEDQ